MLGAVRPGIGSRYAQLLFKIKGKVKRRHSMGCVKVDPDMLIRPYRAAFLTLLLLIVAVTGCKPKQADVEAQPKVRQSGSVSVSGTDNALQQWVAPTVQVTPENVDSLLQTARDSAGLGNWFQDERGVLPIVLAINSASSISKVQRDQAEQLRERAVTELIQLGQARIRLMDSSPIAMAESDMIAAVLRTAAPGEERTYPFLDSWEQRRTIALLNSQAQDLIDAGRLGESTERGAQGAYRKVLELDSSNATALNGLANIEQLMIIKARQEADNHWYNLATLELRRAQQVRGDKENLVAQAIKDLEVHRQAYLQQLLDNALLRLPQQNGLKFARTQLVEMIRVARSPDPLVTQLATRVELFEHYGQFRPGQTFTDSLGGSGHGPKMIVVPHGAFVMGSKDDPDANTNEKPAHEIRFAKGFALAVHEVTVAEFGRFIAATKHRTRASRRGFSTIYSEKTGNYARQSWVDWYSDFHGNPAAMNGPVMHVSQRDAQAYIDWLAEQTGKKYRLPSEAEFEYALRAGSTERFPWGMGSPSKKVENLTGLLDVSASRRKWNNGFAGYGDGFWGPAPVSSFPANAFGLHDMGGNLSEWTADCYHANFRRAPADGKAWFNSGCRSYIVKGGSWASSPEQTRSAFRMRVDADTTNAKMGFRVARDL